MQNLIGVAEYQFSKKIPKGLEVRLPSIEKLEEELAKLEKS